MERVLRIGNAGSSNGLAASTGSVDRHTRPIRILCTADRCPNLVARTMNSGKKRGVALWATVVVVVIVAYAANDS